MITPFRIGRPLGLAFLLALPFGALAQTGVGIGTTAPDASAALDIVSSTKGALLPRVASAAALATPATGLLVFQTGAPAGFYYNAGDATTPKWLRLTDSAGLSYDPATGLQVGPGPVGTGLVTVGTGGSTAALYQGSATDARHQFLYRAADLTAAGLVAGPINSLAFFVAVKNSTLPFPNFTIKVGHTTATTATGAMLATSTVFTGPVTTVPGWNTHPFSTPFVWDGTSNLVIETCFDNTAAISDDLGLYTPASYQGVRTLAKANDAGCALLTTTSGVTNSPSNTTPNVRFGQASPGSYALPAVAGVAGQVLTQQANGSVAFQDAQWTQSGTSLFPTNPASRVGLGGSAAPAAKLEIQGGAESNGTNDPVALAFSWRGVGLRHFVRSRHSVSPASGGGNSLDFYLNSSSSPTGSTAPGTGNIHVLTIENALNSPRVGIGTTTPSTALDVNGNARIRTLAGNDTRLPVVLPDGTLSVSPPVYTATPGGANVASGTIATATGPLGLTVSGTTAYVVGGANTLQLFDVSNPTAMTLLGSVATDVLPFNVVVSGTTAYVVNQTSRTLQVFDVSNPAAPALLGSAATANAPISLAVSGTRVYVVNNASNSLQVFDVATPAAPVLVGTVATANTPYSVAVSGTTVYVTGYANLLQVFNAANPAAPVLQGSVATGTASLNVAVSGTTVYVVNYNANTFQTFDVSNPAAPVLLATRPTGGQPHGVAVSGTRAYVVNRSSNTLQTFDVTDPAAPVSLGIVTTGSQPYLVAASGPTAYVINNGGNTLQAFGPPAPPRTVAVNNDGSFASYPLPSGLDFIENQSATNQAASFRITGNGLVAGNVGVGTNTPTQKLDVRSADGSARIVVGTAANTGGGLVLGNTGHGLQRGFPTLSANNHVGLYTTSGNVYLSTNGATTGEFELAGGTVSIGGELRTQNPANRLRRATTPQSVADQFDGGSSGVHLSNNENEEGGFWANGEYAAIYSPGDNDLVKFLDEDGFNGGGTAYDNGALKARIDGSGQYFQVSDAKAKHDITPIADGLRKLTALSGYTYAFNLLPNEAEKGQKAQRAAGVLAQEVEQVLPEAVSQQDGHYMVNYAALTPLFIQAMKELKAENDALKARVATAEAQAAAATKAFEARLRALEAGGPARK
ncbi:tail fiber domain-containing protein [Hymenobacter sp. ASUV-10]|uniref:Tail fiber domain-containing protein n=1 Tax=Hymenobacter aranciens TaxID=3063996 RepID=A0ABT9B7P5_9BACT|nr:tail fiber domain-containing protein [Hymenobacter sp. ASUV-10]MDO7873820.1 tail fiber domain-containing protein [Hymenobacter sp. ASUV-10]